MTFLIFGPRSKTAICRFEDSGRLPNQVERAKLERDLAELDAARERVLAVLTAKKPTKQRK